MIFVAINSHQPDKCPFDRKEGRVMIKKLFSPEQSKRFGVKIIGAYLSCPKSSGQDHKSYFIVEASDTTSVFKFFGPMAVDLRQVTPYSQVLKTL